MPRYLTLVVASLLVGCSIQSRECGVLFEKLKGQGPVLIDPSNTTVTSTRFFRDTWQASPSVQHLVTSRGTPDAISVEREFLQPNRLKFFYPTAGQVYILDDHEGDWFVTGSEPLANTDLELLNQQRDVRAKRAVGDAAPVLPALRPAVVEQAPVAKAQSGDFRGRLKPPSQAGEAGLSKQNDRGFIHTVSFPGEDFALLADWYTENSANAAKLARANKKSPGQVLHPGDQIVIPAALMLNPAPLPEAIVP